MKVKNIGTLDITVKGTPLAAGEISANIDDTVARQLVAASAGSLALAPESEHTAEELEHADEKKKPEEPESTKEEEEESKLRSIKTG
jgi:hypothetical protein